MLAIESEENHQFETEGQIHFQVVKKEDIDKKKLNISLFAIFLSEWMLKKSAKLFIKRLALMSFSKT